LTKAPAERSVTADNVPDRQFTADEPNRKWVADFTFIWTAESWLIRCGRHRPFLQACRRLVDERRHVADNHQEKGPAFCDAVEFAAAPFG